MGCTEEEKHTKNKRCAYVRKRRRRGPYGLRLPCSPAGGVHGAVQQCINLAGFNGKGRQQPTSPHSHSNSTSASLSSSQMDRGYKLEEPGCLCMSLQSKDARRIFSSEVILQILTKAILFHGDTFEPGICYYCHALNLWFLLKYPLDQQWQETALQPDVCSVSLCLYWEVKRLKDKINVIKSQTNYLMS